MVLLQNLQCRFKSLDSQSEWFLNTRANGGGSGYLEVSALFIDGDDEPVDVSDELVPLRLPQAVAALLQQLHQHLLNKHSRR